MNQFQLYTRNRHPPCMTNPTRHQQVSTCRLISHCTSQLTAQDLWPTATPSHASSDYSLPSEVYDEPLEATTTVTSTKTHVETTAVPQFPSSSPLPGTTTPPYPVSSAWPTSLTPSGTGSLRPSTPAFTAAAAVVGPGSLVGVLGVLVYVL
jgi:hypothetical protein